MSLLYREILENTESVFNDNGTLSFIPRRELKFIREMSVGDPKEQYVHVPNVPLLVSSYNIILLLVH